MNCFFKYFTICAIAIFAYSCASYHTFTVDMLSPAEYSIPPDIKSVVLVDHSTPHIDTIKNTLIVDNRQSDIDIIQQNNFTDITLKALKKELNLRKFYDTVYYYNKPIKKDLLHPNRALNWLQVDSICNMYNADAIISIESNYYRTMIKAKSQYDGSYFTYMDVNGGISWRGYNRLDRQSLFNKGQMDTISWQASTNSVDGAIQQFPTIKSAYSDLAEYLGHKAADYTTPAWHKEIRGFYGGGNYLFMQADNFVRSQKYGEAIKLWKYIYDHAKTKNKARATYNLAVAAEINGDFTSAKYWLKIAIDIYNSTKKSALRVDKEIASVYIQILNRRAATMHKLKEQIGGTL